MKASARSLARTLTGARQGRLHCTQPATQAAAEAARAAVLLYHPLGAPRPARGNERVPLRALPGSPSPRYPPDVYSTVASPKQYSAACRPDAPSSPLACDRPIALSLPHCARSASTSWHPTRRHAIAGRAICASSSCAACTVHLHGHVPVHAHVRLRIRMSIPVICTPQTALTTPVICTCMSMHPTGTHGG